MKIFDDLAKAEALIWHGKYFRHVTPYDFSHHHSPTEARRLCVLWEMAKEEAAAKKAERTAAEVEAEIVSEAA